MIDLSYEEILTLPRACQLPELRRNGRGPHVTTMLRWATRGCRGPRLGTYRIGGRRCTTRAAVARFLNQLNHRQVATSVPSVGHARAEAFLTLNGI